MVWGTWPLWGKIAFYVYLIGALFIYTMLSKLKMMGINLIKQRDRILISIFYPFAIMLSLVAIPFLLLALMITPVKTKVFNIRINKIQKP